MHSLNKIYPTIWSEALNAWVAVLELVKSKGNRSGASLLRVLNIAGVNDETDDLHRYRFKLALLAASCLLTFQTHANPMGGNVVNGQASFNTSGNTLTVTNTPGAIIHWQDFSIQQNEITRFAQQSASSTVLNRVVGGNTSQILGSLQSNGRVFLVNPNGVLFGAGSTVDVAGLVATSLNLSDADFLAGRNRFSSDPNAQAVSNAGNLTAQQGGEIWLIAPDVENTGVITAPNGEILLAAGSSVELVNSLDPALRVNITAPAGDATNVGQLVASAGSLGLFGTVVRNSGQVSADSATLQGGKIVFKSSQRTEISGTASAQGVGGGEIKVLSDMQTGTVEISGTLDASAPVSGDGGFIDTSAAHLDIAPDASIKANAPNGNAGEWLIDPFDVTIGTGTTINISQTVGGVWTPYASGSFLTSGTIVAALNAGTNVTVTTVNALGTTQAGNITVNSAITKTTGTVATLTLNAENDINLNANISATSAGGMNLVLAADADNSGVGQTNLGAGITINLNSGTLDAGGKIVDLSAGTVTLSGTTWDNAGTLDINGTGQLNIVNSGVFTNTNTGTVNYNGSSATPVTWGGTGAGTFNNAGTLNKTATSVATQGTNTSLVFNNTGAVNINSGTYQLAGSGADTGSYNLATAAEILQVSGNRSFTGVTLTGPGTFLHSAGTLTIVSPYTQAATGDPVWSMTGGTITNDGGMTLNGVFNWGGGTINGAGVLTTTASATSTLGSNAATLYGATWNNAGVLDITGTGRLNLSAGGVLSNTGTVNYSGSSATPVTWGGTGAGTFNNANILNKAIGSAATQSINGSLTFNNTGTVNVNEGTLDAAATFTQSGTINVTTGAVFSKTAGFTNTGTLTGNGTIAVGTGTSKLVNQGNIDPGGAGTAGTLSITGDLQLAAGSMLNLDMGGIVAGQYDVLAVTGALSGNATSFGGLTLTKIGGYMVAPNDVFPLITSTSGLDTAAFDPFTLLRATQTPAYTANSFSITADPMIVTITADTLSKIYGTADPGSYTFTATGFDATTGDNAGTALSGALTRAAGENAGLYAINQGTIASPFEYTIVVAPVDFTITPATLTLTAVTDSKVYDGTTTSVGSVGISTMVGADTVTGVTQSFASANVLGANGSTLNVDAGYTVNDGNGGLNYSVSSNTAAGTISPFALTVGAAGVNRVYDASTGATVTLNDNRLGSDVLTLGYGSATFLDKNVATGKTVNVSGITLGTGGDEGNYSFNSTASTTAEISPFALTVGAVGVNRVYDATTNATVSLNDNRFGGDVITSGYSTASFFDKNVGTAKQVEVAGITVTGTDAGNYSFNSTATTTADISPFALTVGAVGVNRVYDATTNATVSLNDNRLGSDVLTLGYGSATFLDKNVATGKTVNVSGINVTGTDAGNYTFNGTATTTANITQLASVNWIGGSGNAWATAANWAGGALPDGMNVAAVVIPSGATVVYDSSVGSTTLNTLTNNGSLTIADGSTLTVLSSLSNTSNLTLNVQGILDAMSASASNTGTINIAAGASPTLYASSLNNQGVINIGNGNSILSVSGTLNNQVAINSVGTTGSRTLNAGTLLNGGMISMAYPMTVAGVSYAAGTTLSDTTSAPPEYEQIARDITNIALNTDMDTSEVDGLTDEERKKKAEQALDDGETAVAEAGGQFDHLPVCQ